MPKTLEALKSWRKHHRWLKTKKAIHQPNWAENITPKISRWLRKEA